MNHSKLTLLALLAFAASSLHAAPAATPAQRACHLWRIGSTPSMLPMIQPHGWVITDSTPFAKLKVGDVALYVSPLSWIETPVCHMIVGGDASRKVMKGIHNASEDRGYMTEANYIGRVVMIQGRAL